MRRKRKKRNDEEEHLTVSPKNKTKSTNSAVETKCVTPPSGDQRSSMKKYKKVYASNHSLSHKFLHRRLLIDYIIVVA